MANIPKEINDLAEMYFNKYDVNKNNKIEKDELKLLMTDVAHEISIPLPNDDDIVQVMEDIDINHNNYISREEFIQLVKIIYVMKKF